MKKIIVFIYCFACGFQLIGQSSYRPVNAIPQLEIDTNTVNFKKQKHFKNTVTGKKVSVLHSIENTGFHFYNSLSFKNENEGIIAGGTGLRLRSTKDGGKHWLGLSFSRFANAFYSATFYNNQFFVVGASRYIFKNEDLNKEWQAFDVANLGENKYELRHPKFYKIKFLEDGLGFIVGANSGKPLMLKTTDKGVTWRQVKLQGLQAEEALISDLFIFPDHGLWIVTAAANVYKSTNEGTDWQLLRSGNQGESLNSIAFKNKNEAYVSGLQGLLLKTKDGGKTWEQINTEILGRGANISNLEYTANKRLLLTTAESFQPQQNKNFVFSINKNGELAPFLSSEEHNFSGDSYGLQLLNNKVFILDRDKLYKTSL